MKVVIAAALAALLAAAAPASAQKLDLSTVKCKDFLQSGTENIAFVMMWLHGYYTDQEAPPIVDFDKMKADLTKVADYCRQNPETGLITAAEELLQ